MRLTILFFLFINFLFAQKSDLTGSIIAFNKQDLETAKRLIDVAYDKYMQKIEQGEDFCQIFKCTDFGWKQKKDGCL